MELIIRAAGGTSSTLEAGGQHIIFDLPNDEGGGDGLNGGEALMMAVGGCCANDLRRLLRRQSLPSTGFTIKVTSDWGGKPVRCQGLACSIKIEGIEPNQALTLIEELGQTSAIPLSIRDGIPVVVQSAQ